MAGSPLPILGLELEIRINLELEFPQECGSGVSGHTLPAVARVRDMSSDFPDSGEPIPLLVSDRVRQNPLLFLALCATCHDSKPKLEHTF